MTEPKTTRRRRRTTGVTGIPKSIAEWFAGERRVSFVAVSWPHRYAIPDYWAAWLTEHPDAEPPEGLHLYLREPTPGSFAASLRDRARRGLGLPAI